VVGRRERRERDGSGVRVVEVGGGWWRACFWGKEMGECEKLRIGGRMERKDGGDVVLRFEIAT
jgi:hypothetical protein